MTAEAGLLEAVARPRWPGRVRSGLVAAWGAFIGLAPHVLHHVGPLAGAALLAGAGGTLLFGAIGLVLAVPFLLRLRRRFGDWRVPLLALAVFAAMFTLSATVIGPAISGAGSAKVPPGQQMPADHASHHSG